MKYIALLCILLLSSQTVHTSDESDVNTYLDEVTLYMHFGRGLFVGFMGGLYNQEEPTVVTELCLSQEISAQISDFVHDYLEFKPLNILSMVADSSSIIANIEECGVEQAIEDIVVFCQTNQCTSTTLLTHYQTSMFMVFEKINAIIAVYPEFPGENGDELEEQGETLGRAVGQLLRLGLGFKTLKY